MQRTMVKILATMSLIATALSGCGRSNVGLTSDSQLAAADTGFHPIATCNNGAAVLDRQEYTQMIYTGRGDPGTPVQRVSYQVVIRDHGVIEYLISQGAIGRFQINNHGEYVTPVGPIGDAFTTDMAFALPEPYRAGQPSYAYGIRHIYVKRQGDGLLFEAFLGAPLPERVKLADWYFQSCAFF